MIYDMENTYYAGNPVRVFDANGQEIRYCLECDTETGRVMQLSINEDGTYEEHNGDIVRVVKKYPAPLLVVPVREEDLQ